MMSHRLESINNRKIKVVTKVIFNTIMFTTFLATSVSARDVALLLGKNSIARAIAATSNGVRVSGGVLLKTPDGNEVTDGDLMILAKWLKKDRNLPSNLELLKMLDDKNAAVRVFSYYCLKTCFSDLPKFNPFFPPGHQKEQLHLLGKHIALRSGEPRAPNQ